MKGRTARAHRAASRALAALACMAASQAGAQQSDWCSHFLQAAGVDAAVAGRSEPFEAVFQATEQFSYDPRARPPDCAGILGRVSGLGGSLRLGWMRLASSNCAFVDDAGVLSFAGADVQLTASGGQAVYGRYCGIAMPEAPGSARNVVVGRFVITGIVADDGSYRPATGHGRITGEETLLRLPGTAIPYLGLSRLRMDGVLVR